MYPLGYVKVNPYIMFWKLRKRGKKSDSKVVFIIHNGEIVEKYEATSDNDVADYLDRQFVVLEYYAQRFRKNSRYGCKSNSCPNRVVEPHGSWPFLQRQKTVTEKVDCSKCDGVYKEVEHQVEDYCIYIREILKLFPSQTIREVTNGRYSVYIH